MEVQQIYTKCLAQGAYYIRSGNEAAVIDPLREVGPYIEQAQSDGVTIKYIFETHFHADFVSGHVTLADETGATIVYGPTAKTGFDAYIAKDGEDFKVGDVTIRLLHTPGHTLESSCFLLINEEGEEVALFSGDTLFLGDVGRPDLAQKGAELTEADLAGMLYDSLRTKIMPLPDHINVYPAHGAGSACGKNMMKETVDTLGNQKKVNYALRADMTKDEFISEVTDGLLPPPGYFPLNVKMNKQGYESIDRVMDKGLRALSPVEFEAISTQDGVIMLDVRHQRDFVAGHIPGSIFIGLNGSFAPWVGELLIDVTTPIVLITPEGKEAEAVRRLSRVGFDNTLGYLQGGISAWSESGRATDTLESVPATALEAAYNEGICNIYDVRRPGEFAASHIDGAKHVSLSVLKDRIAEFPREEVFYVHCAGGYRSVIAASILKANGIHRLIDVQGGFGAIEKTGLPITDFVCPSTL